MPSRVAGYSMANTASTAQSAQVTFTVPTANCGGLPKKWGAQSVEEGVGLITETGESVV